MHQKRTVPVVMSSLAMKIWDGRDMADQYWREKFQAFEQENL